jgi:hypothetical protein
MSAGAGYPPGYGTGGFGTGGLNQGVPSVSYYLSLLTSEYKLAPNLNAWLLAVLQPLSDIALLVSQIAFPAFSLPYAVGPQLDFLGQMLGAARTVPFQPSNSVSPVLTDSAYRILLEARVLQNQWDGKIASLYPFWQNLFPGGKIAIIDNHNMTATIILSGAFTSITQDMITNGLIVPRPEGVQYTYEFPVLPAFGFDSSPGYIAGFDLGHWS